MVSEIERILPHFQNVGYNEIREAFGIAIGRASLCWEDTFALKNAGVFDDKTASQLVDELTDLIDRFLMGGGADDRVESLKTGIPHQINITIRELHLTMEVKQ